MDEEKQVTINEVMGAASEVIEVVNFLKDNAASQESVDDLAEQMQELKKDLSETRFSLGAKVDSLSVRMVTKEHLDDKIADVRGDFGSLVRKEDAKLRAVVGALEQEKLISKDKVSKISAMEPFPQLAL
ncbi:MAG: hypothetical protein AAB575_01155 [Patescibacteria group bacterium]